MKKILFLTLVFAISLISSSATFGQEFDELNKSPMDVARYPYSWRNPNKVLKVTYSRPQLKGRSLEKLAPIGKRWRLGANEATEVTFYEDVNFGGKNIKAGTYTMYAIPGEKEWTIAISSQLNVWGTYFHEEKYDVARVTGKVSKADKKFEAFTIAFGDDMTMHLAWADTLVSIPISKK